MTLGTVLSNENLHLSSTKHGEEQLPWQSLEQNDVNMRQGPGIGGALRHQLVQDKTKSSLSWSDQA